MLGLYRDNKLKLQRIIGIIRELYRDAYAYIGDYILGLYRDTGKIKATIVIGV